MFKLGKSILVAAVLVVALLAGPSATALGGHGLSVLTAHLDGRQEISPTGTPGAGDPDGRGFAIVAGSDRGPRRRSATCSPCGRSHPRWPLTSTWRPLARTAASWSTSPRPPTASPPIASPRASCSRTARPSSRPGSPRSRSSTTPRASTSTCTTRTSPRGTNPWSAARPVRLAPDQHRQQGLGHLGRAAPRARTAPRPSMTSRWASGKSPTISRAHSTGKNRSCSPQTSCTGTSIRRCSCGRDPREVLCRSCAAARTAASRCARDRCSGWRKNSSNSPSSSDRSTNASPSTSRLRRSRGRPATHPNPRRSRAPSRRR